MYGPTDGALTEESPRLATGKKGRTRTDVAERVLAAHRQGRLRVAIGRSSDYYGPRGTHTVAGERVFGAALRGKKARWLGSLDQPHTLHYLPDMARGLIALATREEADGGVWHLPAAEPLTGRRFLELVFEAAGTPPRVGADSRTTIRVGGLFAPLVRELNETLYQFERPFVSDASKFQRVLGPLQPTPHPEAVRATIEWWRGGRRQWSPASAGDRPRQGGKSRT
jgi:nucleoside-diphosphate-sugar epimerase